MSISTSEKTNASFNFQEVPSNPFEFDPLTLVVRKQGEKVSIEAIGPNGEQVEADTEMPFDPFDPDNIPSSEELGKALLPGPILELEQKLFHAATQEGRGLRLQLDFRGEANCFVYLRWEAIAIEGMAVASDPRLAIVRTTTSAKPPLDFEATEAPYRILLLLSSPKFFSKEKNGALVDLSKSVENDFNGIKKELAPLIKEELIELVPLQAEKATLENLKSQLSKGSFQALYYAGPSSFGNYCLDPDQQQATLHDGYLYFDDGNGIAEAVSGEMLSQLLIGTTVRLVFLNACNTAYGRPNQHESEGIAEALLNAGMPAVVGYEVNTYDPFSSVFAGAFYKALTQLNSLELAMYAGQKAMADGGAGVNNLTGPNWSDPWLFTRIKAGAKVLSGDISGKISAIVNDKGDLEFIEQKQDESDLDIFNRQLKSLNTLLQRVQDLEARTVVQNEVMQATRKLKSNSDEAINQLSSATMDVVSAIKKEEAKKNQEQELLKKKQEEEDAAWKRERKELDRQRKLLIRKQLERTIVLSMALLMITVVGVLAYFMDEKAEIKVLGLPLPVVLWSFIGGVGATLYAFVGTQKYAQTEPLRLDWLIGRPVVGVIMGSVVYLAIATSLGAIGDVEIGTGDQKPFLLWALAFLGGFSDKFALLLFDSLVGKYSTGGKIGEEDPGSPTPAQKAKQEKPASPTSENGQTPASPEGSPQKEVQSE